MLKCTMEIERKYMKDKTTFLICERNWVYRTLMFISGFYGGYAFLMLDGIFCNAQTGNLVQFALHINHRE